MCNEEQSLIVLHIFVADIRRRLLLCASGVFKGLEAGLFPPFGTSLPIAMECWPFHS